MARTISGRLETREFTLFHHFRLQRLLHDQAINTSRIQIRRTSLIYATWHLARCSFHTRYPRIHKVKILRNVRMICTIHHHAISSQMQPPTRSYAPSQVVLARQQSEHALSPNVDTFSTPAATTRNIFLRNIHCFRIVDRFGEVSGHRTDRCSHQSGNLNLQYWLCCLCAVTVPLSLCRRPSGLFGI